MYADDTIAAVVTPPGRGGVSIVRLSGSAALAIGGSVFKPSRRSAVGRNVLRHGHVIDATGEPIDEVLAAIMRAPRSYTGEDVLELHCHGSPVVVRAVLARLLACGARAARPGEFTERAFLNGRIDLVQAEAVAELIGAQTEAAARTGLRHLSGALSGELALIRESLLNAKAHLEVLIDFSEEEIDASHENLEADLERAASRITPLLQSFRFGRLLRMGLHLTLLGRPNVGKSSLLNALLGEDRAIVAAEPGTTRDVIAESVDIDGIAVVLSDTAGLRTNPGAIERLGIERTRRQAAMADAVLLVLDRSEPLTPEDDDVLAEARGVPSIVVVNKIDLPLRWRTAELEPLRGRAMAEVSATAGTGLERLRTLITELAGTPNVDPASPILTVERHRDMLGRAYDSIELARQSIRAGQPADVIGVDIQAAVEHIGNVTGEITTEEVLDRIFRDFCIGK